MHKKNGKPETLPTLACPEGLSPTARQEWDRIAGELIELGVLSQFDAGLLACYCAAYGLWLEAAQHVQTEGVLAAATASGYQAQNPWLAVCNRQAQLVQRLANDLGFTPSSRGRIFTWSLQRKMLLHDPPDLDEIGTLA